MSLCLLLPARTCHAHSIHVGSTFCFVSVDDKGFAAVNAGLFHRRFFAQPPDEPTTIPARISQNKTFAFRPIAGC